MARVGQLRQAEHPRRRLRAHNKIHHATERPQLLQVVVGGEVFDRTAIFHSGGAAPQHREAGGVSHDALLKVHLRAVGKRGHHRHVLVPLFGKALLGGRGAVFVLQALDVAQHQRDQAHALHLAPEVELHAWLIAIAAAKQHSRRPRLLVQDRPDRGIHFRIHQH